MRINLFQTITATCLMAFLSFSAANTAHAESLVGSNGNFTRIDFRPFYIETDVGKDERARKKFGAEYAKIVSRKLNFFLKAFSMKANDFNEYAKF